MSEYDDQLVRGDQLSRHNRITTKMQKMKDVAAGIGEIHSGEGTSDNISVEGEVNVTFSYDEQATADNFTSEGARRRKENLMAKCLDGSPDEVRSLTLKIAQWHYDRNLIHGSTDKDQTLKLLQELGELSDSVCKGKDIRDDLGDMMVVMINIMERNGLNMAECLTVSWNDIKDRKGLMVDGVFVKESDLAGYQAEDYHRGTE